MYTRILAASFLLLSLVASGQEVNQQRIELPLHPGQNIPYRTTSLQENGLLVYGSILVDGHNAIEVMRLDTTFQQVWHGYIQIDFGITLTLSKYYNGKIYLLLKDRNNPRAELQVVAVNIATGAYVISFIKSQIPFIPTHFEITNTGALIGGHFNYRPLILFFNFGTTQSKILPGFFNEPGELDQLTIDDDGTINVVVSGKNTTRRRSLWMRTYSASGDLVKTIVLQPEEDKNLLFGRTVGTANGSQVVCGVYGRYTEYSRGIFTATIDPYGEYKLTYYNFGDLQKFFSYMRPRSEKRIKDKIARRKMKGKKLRFNYRILVSELIEHDDQFVMLGEAFYPHYSYPNSARMMGPTSRWALMTPLGTPLYRGDLVFDGYQYTHAIVIGVGKDGTIKWDNTFEINDVRTFQLEHYVKILPQKDKISLLYLYDNAIRTKVIKGTDVLEGKSYDPLQMQFAADKVEARDTQQTKLEYWYGDVFYATGIQTIQNTADPRVRVSRRVFFINKIQYQ